MNRYRLEIHVTPRPGLLDPQGNAIHHALHSLGFASVDGVRVGKAIHIDLQAASEEEALEVGRAMCGKILANPVTENFDVEILSSGSELRGDAA